MSRSVVTTTMVFARTKSRHYHRDRNCSALNHIDVVNEAAGRVLHPTSILPVSVARSRGLVPCAVCVVTR